MKRNLTLTLLELMVQKGRQALINVLPHPGRIRSPTKEEPKAPGAPLLISQRLSLSSCFESCVLQCRDCPPPRPSLRSGGEHSSHQAVMLQLQLTTASLLSLFFLVRMATDVSMPASI